MTFEEYYIKNNLSKDLNISELYLSGCFLTDLKGIERFKYLKELTIEKNNLVDISPLSELKMLEKLDCQYNRIVDLSPISELINLLELDIDDNNIVDLSPLSKLKNLEILYCTNNKYQQNQLQYISELKNLHGLLTMYINNDLNIEDRILMCRIESRNAKISDIE